MENQKIQPKKNNSCYPWVVTGLVVAAMTTLFVVDRITVPQNINVNADLRMMKGEIAPTCLYYEISELDFTTAYNNHLRDLNTTSSDIKINYRSYSITQNQYCALEKIFSEKDIISCVIYFGQEPGSTLKFPMMRGLKSDKTMSDVIYRTEPTTDIWFCPVFCDESSSLIQGEAGESLEAVESFEYGETITLSTAQSLYQNYQIRTAESTQGVIKYYQISRSQYEAMRNLNQPGVTFGFRLYFGDTGGPNTKVIMICAVGEDLKDIDEEIIVTEDNTGLCPPFCDAPEPPTDAL